MGFSSLRKHNHSQSLLCNGRYSIVMHGFFLFKETHPQSIIIVQWTRQHSHARVLYSVRKDNHSNSFYYNLLDSIVTHRKDNHSNSFYYNLLYSIVTHRKDNHSNSFYYNLLDSIVTHRKDNHSNSFYYNLL